MLALYHDDGPCFDDVAVGLAPLVPCAIVEVEYDYVYRMHILEPTAWGVFYEMNQNEIETQICVRAIPRSCFYRGQSKHVLMYYKAWVWLGRPYATKLRAVCRHWDALAVSSEFLGGCVD